MSAFDSATWEKLMNYATPATPVFLTSLTCYPVLIGEIKSPWIGLQIAEEQALHAAVIALNSQFSLYQKAYEKNPTMLTELYGQALVFGICHNNDEVHVSAYYALPKARPGLGKLDCFRRKLAIWSLTLNSGRDKDKAYNFVEKLHTEFSPKHLKRITDAARLLPPPAPKTAMSFGTSQLSLELSISGENQQGTAPNGENVLAQELTALRATLEDQRQQSQRREQALEKREQDFAKRLAQLLPPPAPKTALSFDTDQLPLKPSILYANQRGTAPNGESVLAQELSALRAILEVQRQQSQDREQEFAERLAQQKEDSKEKERRLEKQLDVITSLFKASQKMRE